MNETIEFPPGYRWGFLHANKMHADLQHPHRNAKISYYVSKPVKLQSYLVLLVQKS